MWISDPAPDILECATSQRVLVAKSPNFLSETNDPEQVLYIKELAEINALYLPPGEDASEPFLGIIYPIIATQEAVRIDVTEEQPVVGDMFASSYWRELITKILPENSVGLIVAFEADDSDKCPGGEMFTYRLDGPNTKFLGAGDLHDDHYDHLEVMAAFDEIMDTFKSDRGSSYTGIPLNNDHCCSCFFPFCFLRGCY
jgi:hypothetical protein